MKNQMLRALPFYFLMAAKLTADGSFGGPTSRASSNPPNFGWEWSFLIPGSVLIAALIYWLRHRESPADLDLDGDPAGAES